MSKERLDVLLVSRGLFESRQKARAEIMAGNILVGNQKLEKAGSLVDDDAEVVILKKDFPYVSRGALKLLKGIEAFGLEVEGKICLDIGASTGGFTEVLLLHGAELVYAVDVGYNQLAWKLRDDSRVRSMEKTNGRNLTPEQLDGRTMDLVVTDVSFISLEKILPAANACLKEGGLMVALIKPQFEAGKGEVSKKGIVTDPKTHIKVIEKIAAFACSEAGFSVLDLSRSPIKGPKGNVEFLVLLRKDEPESRVMALTNEQMKKVVFEDE